MKNAFRLILKGIKVPLAAWRTIIIKEVNIETSCDMGTEEYKEMVSIVKGIFDQVITAAKEGKLN